MAEWLSRRRAIAEATASTILAGRPEPVARGDSGLAKLCSSTF